jgi:hypothetical protein
VLKAQGNALTLNTLRFASEIRSADELRLPVNEKLVPNEVNLALKLIEGMTAEFDPDKYHDTYTDDVKRLIDDKAKGQKRQGAAAARPQQRHRHRRCAAGELGADEAQETRSSLNLIRCDRHLSRPPLSTFEPALREWLHWRLIVGLHFKCSATIATTGWSELRINWANFKDKESILQLNAILVKQQTFKARVQMFRPQFLRTLSEEVPRVMDRHFSGC